MSLVRGALRTVAIWASVVAFFATMGWGVLVNGDPTGLIGFSAYPVVGAVILSSRPRNGLGQFLLGVGMLWTASTVLLAAPLAPWGEVVYSACGWLLWGVLPLVGLLFPAGRVQTRFGRVVAAVLTAFVVTATLAAVTAAPGAAPAALQQVAEVVTGVPGSLLFMACIFAVVGDLAVRWLRSGGVTRLQYRWLFYGLTVTVVVVALMGLVVGLSGSAPWALGGAVVGGLVTNLIPLSIGIAITRHGLFDIDRVVSRTVAYAIVTVLTVAVYAVVVTSATWLLPGAPSLAVAAATLAAAVVCLPVLRRVRRAVDHRFDRERYDAQGLVDDLGERLRTGTDPSRATGDLVATVERALQPVAVGLWTAESSR